MSSNENDTITPCGNHENGNPPKGTPEVKEAEIMEASTNMLAEPTPGPSGLQKSQKRKHDPSMEVDITPSDEETFLVDEEAKAPNRQQRKVNETAFILTLKNKFRQARNTIERAARARVMHEVPREKELLNVEKSKTLLEVDDIRIKNKLSYRQLVKAHPKQVETAAGIEIPIVRINYDDPPVSDSKDKRRKKRNRSLNNSPEEVPSPPEKKGILKKSPRKAADLKSHPAQGTSSENKVFTTPRPVAKGARRLSVNRPERRKSVSFITGNANPDEKQRQQSTPNRLSRRSSSNSRRASASVNHRRPSTNEESSSTGRRNLVNITQRRPSTREEKNRSGSSKRRPSFTKSIKVPVMNIDKVPYSEICKMSLKVTIVDENSPDLHMSVQHFSMIEHSIQRALWSKLKNEGRNFSFTASMDERYKGFRIISCGTEETLNFVKSTIAGLGELWPGASIKVRHLNELPCDPMIKLNLPISDMDNPLMILDLLMMANPEFNVSKWKIIQYGKFHDGRIPVLFRVDENSIKLLEEKNNRLFYGIRSVMVSLQELDICAEEEKNAMGIDDFTDNVCDISGLFNAGLELDKVPETMEQN